MAEQPRDAVDDRESEPQALRPVAFRAARLIELLEDPRLVGRGDADAGVGDDDLGLAAVPPAADDDAALARIADRVRDEVEQAATEQGRVALGPERRRHDAEAQPLLFGGRPELVGETLEQGLQREGAPLGLNRAGVELRDVEQRVEQILEGGDRAVDAPRERRELRRARGLAQLADGEGERMHRLAEIVARRGEEPRLRLVRPRELLGALRDTGLERRVGLLEPRGHAVELRAERVELVAGADVDAFAELAGADPLRARAERLDRPRHAPREEVACGERAEEAERTEERRAGHPRVYRRERLGRRQLGEHRPTEVRDRHTHSEDRRAGEVARLDPRRRDPRDRVAHVREPREVGAGKHEAEVGVRHELSARIDHVDEPVLADPRARHDLPHES